MNAGEIAFILDRMGTAFSVEVPAEAVQIWTEIAGNVDGPIALAACDRIIAKTDQRGFPLVGKFLDVVGEIHRENAREANQRGPELPGRSRDCPLCAGYGIYEVDPIVHVDETTGEVRHDEQWKPCQRCDPQRYDAWTLHNTRRRKEASLRPADLLERDPSEVFAEARDALNPVGS